MELVIDIDKEDYKRIQDTSDVFNSLTSRASSAIRNGIPLPEGAEILSKEAYSDLCIRAEDHEGEGMTYKEKSAIVISQLRANRDRLQDALDKIRVEIKRQEKWLLQTGYTVCNVDIALDAIKAAAKRTVRSEEV